MARTVISSGLADSDAAGDMGDPGATEAQTMPGHQPAPVDIGLRAGERRQLPLVLKADSAALSVCD